jgi:voltage-dependent calcium channel L type alpha-1F
MHPDGEDLICGGYQECPGGYFCGKSNANPNYGVTNFDNLFYALLCVFQCVTLEGWSDIQRQMQQAMSYIMFIYFVPLVFIGAFFLLNLTLAVINSEFTKAHREQQAMDEEALKDKNNSHNQENDELEALNRKDEMSIA